MHRLTIVIAVLLSTAAGCQVWEPVEGVPDDGQTVRVVTRGGGRITLEDVAVRQDSLFSEAHSCAWTVAYGRAPGRVWCGGVAVARADVVRVEVPRGNAAWRTFLYILAGIFVAALAIGALELLAGGVPALSSSADRPRVREEVPSRR